MTSLCEIEDTHVAQEKQKSELNNKIGNKSIVYLYIYILYTGIYMSSKKIFFHPLSWVYLRRLWFGFFFGGYSNQVAIRTCCKNYFDNGWR